MSKVLLVDDDDDLLELLRLRLEANGFDCRMATSVPQGLEVMKRFTPEIIILDLGFQDYNGFDFLQCVHEHYSMHEEYQPKIIVLSGETDPEIIQYTLDAGANHFMTKPYDSQTLLKNVFENAYGSQQTEELSVMA